MDRKAANTAALRERMLLRDGPRPILAYVGRLDTQKGLHLIRHALFYALEQDAQFVLLGSGSEHGINEDFWHLKLRLNDNPDCHLEIGYDEDLAHLIYAGADLLVMPSLYEPCGLTQMIALRYGTVPVVRAVGGLKDTVFDWDYSELPRRAAQRLRLRARRPARARVRPRPCARPVAQRSPRCSASWCCKGWPATTPGTTRASTTWTSTNSSATSRAARCPRSPSTWTACPT